MKVKDQGPSPLRDPPPESAVGSAGWVEECWGSLTQPPGSATDEEKDYQDMICLGRKGGQSLRGEGP